MTQSTITLAELQQSDAVWCAGSAERERLSQLAPQAGCVVCPQGDQLEISEGRSLPLREAAGYLAACGAQRLVRTPNAVAPPGDVTETLPLLMLHDACGAEDFMDDEDTALVEQRLRELGYI